MQHRLRMLGGLCIVRHDHDVLWNSSFIVAKLQYSSELFASKLTGRFVEQVSVGSATMARAMATRCSVPESWRGR